MLPVSKMTSQQRITQGIICTLIAFVLLYQGIMMVVSALGMPMPAQAEHTAYVVKPPYSVTDKGVVGYKAEVQLEDGTTPNPDFNVPEGADIGTPMKYWVRASDGKMAQHPFFATVPTMVVIPIVIGLILLGRAGYLLYREHRFRLTYRCAT